VLQGPTADRAVQVTHLRINDRLTLIKFISKSPSAASLPGTLSLLSVRKYTATVSRIASRLAKDAAAAAEKVEKAAEAAAQKASEENDAKVREEAEKALADAKVYEALAAHFVKVRSCLRPACWLELEEFCTLFPLLFVNMQSSSN